MFDKITYSDRWSKHPHFNNSHPDDPYMLNGYFSDEYIKRCIDNNEEISRASENIIPLYLVYESDTLPLEEQLKVIENISKKYIRYITFSGHKSYHVLFKINVPPGTTKEEYKKIWTIVMKEYNILQYADTQCGSLSRLTRNPNGFNKDHNARQTCIYDNPNCESINLHPLIEKIRNKEKEQAQQQNIFEKYSDKKQTSSTPEDVISRINAPCRAKEGYDMWKHGNFPSGGEFLGCARGMYNICISAGCNEVETIEFCRQFLLAASEAHPSNISKNKAMNWKPLHK